MKSIMQTKKECYVCRSLVGAEIKLFLGAGLYRFTDCNGVECSAIWLDDTEMCWDYTEKEQELIDYWEGRRTQL